MLPFVVILGVIAGLMLLEPHLSGTVLILGIGGLMMFVGGTGLVWFGLAIAGVVAVSYTHLTFRRCRTMQRIR